MKADEALEKLQKVIETMSDEELVKLVKESGVLLEEKSAQYAIIEREILKRDPRN